MSENEPTPNEPETVAPVEAELAEGVPVETIPAQTAAVETEPVQATPVQAAVVEPEPAEPEAIEAVEIVEVVQASPVEPATEAAPTQPAQTEPQGWAPAEPVAPAPGFSAELPVRTLYLQPPTPPKAKSNRLFALMVTTIGTVLFAALYAGFSYIYMSMTGTARLFEEFLQAPVFWGPVIAFFAAWTLLGLIINRGPWWAHAVFGLLVGVVVYLAWVGFALITRHVWEMSNAEATEFLRQQWLSPYALIAGLTAREIPIWLGGWIARHGRRVTARNEAALEEYEREVAAGPVFS